jgi:hypothetical protein
MDEQLANLIISSLDRLADKVAELTERVSSLESTCKDRPKLCKALFAGRTTAVHQAVSKHKGKLIAALAGALTALTALIYKLAEG